MIEEFIIKLADGREIKVQGEVLSAKLPEDAAEILVTTLKSDTLEAMLLKMSEYLTEVKGNG